MDGKQLKNSILQWAIQGKLVPQNPKDEPASKLLERITAARNESTQTQSKGAKSKKSALTSRIYRENGVWYEQVGNAEPKDISDDIPFEIPENWAWCRLGSLIKISSGDGLVAKDMKKGEIPVFGGNGITGYHTEANVFEETVVIGRVGFYCGSVHVTPAKAWITDNAFITEYPQKYIDRGFLVYCLKFLDLGKSHNATAQPVVSGKKIYPLLFPLPPLAEQKRIVAKLGQVLPLADEYGAAQEQLDKLNKELPETLKKSILQQAIQGKLVSQNPKDEPAQKLLERIAAARSETTQLKGAKSKKSAPTSCIYCENGTWYEQIGNAAPKDVSEDIPFEIPENWTWCRLNSICDYLHRGKSPSYSDKKILPVMAQKCNQWDRIYTEKCLFADPKTIDRYLPEHFLQLGDILINSTGGGTVGRTGYVDEYVFSEYDKFVADSHVTVVRSNKNICSKYVYYFLITPLIQTGIEERCSGSTNQIELGTETVKNYLIPLPPLAEQKRIVIKLEQLFKVL